MSYSKSYAGVLQSVARAAGQRVSVLPENMVQGGLIDDIDVVFQNCRYVIFDYNGKSDPKTCLLVEMLDDDGGVHEQYFSAANPEHFVPSDDETYLVSTGEKGNLNKGSNFALFAESLIAEGFPGPAFEESAASLNGLRAHIIRRPAPKRTGIVRRPGQEDREQTVLVISKILALPGQGQGKGGGKAAAKVGGKAPAKAVQAQGQAKPNGGAGKPVSPASLAAAAKSSKAAAQAQAQAADDTDLDARLMELVGEILGEQGGVVEKKALAMQTYRKAGADDKRIAPKRVVDDEFLEQGAAMGLWMFDADSGTISAAE